MTHDEVTAAMKAEDVDAALVERAARAIEGLPYGLGGPGSRAVARQVLAAAIPEVQAQVLTDAARDLRAAYKEPPTHVLTAPQQAAWQIGMARAHGIVRDLSRAARLAATTGESTHG